MKIIKIAIALMLVLILFGCQDSSSPDAILGYWYMPGGSRNWRSLEFMSYGEVHGKALGGRQFGTYNYAYFDGVLTIYSIGSYSETVTGTAVKSGSTLLLSGFESHWIEDGVYYLQ